MAQMNMMRGLLALLPTLWLLFVLVHHGESRLVSNNMNNSVSAYTDGASSSVGPQHAAASKSIPKEPVTTCIWVCEDADYDDQCQCVPVPPHLDELWETEGTIDSALVASAPVAS